jgi:ABC-type enterobactin transport system permease subunit
MRLRTLVFALATLAPATAFAHPGDHMAMSAAQVAHHIVTSPDHLAELIMAGLMLVGLGIRQRRRAAR